MTGDDLEDRLDRLESQLEDQQATIEDQQATIREQRERIDELEAGSDPPGDEGASEEGVDPSVSRRSALKAGGVLAALGLGVGATAGTASGDPQGQVGTSSDPLKKLYTEEIDGGVTGDQALTDLQGDGLRLSGGALTADLNRVGSGVGVLDGTGSSAIDHRSLSGADGVSVTESGGTITVGATSTSVQTDSASTFQESDVTVTNDGTAVNRNRQALEWSGPASSSTASRPADNKTVLASGGKFGIVIVPNVDLSGITASVSANTSGGDRILLTDDSLNVLASTSFTTGSVEFDYPLFAGRTYFVLTDASSGYDVGYNGGSFPYTSTNVDITAGYDKNNGVNDIYDFSFDSITGKEVARATVAFPSPSSVSRWESATYRHETNGGFLRVYPQTSSDGGSSWSDWRPAPIGPGEDLSAIPPGDRVRFRFEFGTDSGSSDPRLTLLNRQYSP